jgi:hypothetical protein
MKNIRNTNGNSQSPYAVQNYNGSGVDNDIVVFDGNSGVLIKDSTVSLHAPNSSIAIGGGLSSVTTGEKNTACGVLSMQNYTTGNNNCAYGWASLMNCNGDGNCAIGFEAGLNYTTESYNVLLQNYGTVGFGTDFPNKDPSLSICTGIGDGCLNRITTGVANTATGALSMQYATTASTNCAYGYSALRQLVSGVGNHIFGTQGAINYNGSESYNIIIGSVGGVAGESNVTRIGSGQSKCFVSGIYGITPAGATQSVIIDSNGQLGSVATSSGPSFESTTSTIAIDSPATFGNITVYFSRIDKSVTCVIAAKTHDFTGSPQNQISTLGGVIPASYRPVENVLFPMIFKSNGVYDTGLVGNVIVSSAGAFLFSRDNDAAPSDFDGVAGWGWAISLSWVTA